MSKETLIIISSLLASVALTVFTRVLWGAGGGWGISQALSLVLAGTSCWISIKNAIQKKSLDAVAMAIFPSLWMLLCLFISLVVLVGPFLGSQI
ncbi:hypothetical protein [Stenotrophobium rhamnosiphilum]|uniref:Uncharacterized protein n=1 Tax=Stenotrophobium rhamnosiphilum TaxID=2029166 RepID=A0A2T5MJT7_9GAMM|nr:hypothetical protein [Stenotrophobium rhamnosiphilum]PTU32846.1 hypothetical protein CJD38_01665 [Stenotrophobium rhamnosiphilum]